MKMKRTAAILAVAVLAAAALVLPAFAATFTLGNFTIDNGATQKGWSSNGTDNKETGLPIETLTSAKYLVLELSKAPEGGMQLIWQGNGDGDKWDWNQTDGVIPNDGTDETTIRIDLAKTLKNYNQFKASTQAKIILGYYSNDISDLGITRAYLEGVTTSGAGSSAQTGDNTAIKAASFILLFTAGAVALLTRRLRTK